MHRRWCARVIYLECLGYMLAIALIVQLMRQRKSGSQFPDDPDGMA